MTEEFAKVGPPPPKFGVTMLAGQIAIIVPHAHRAGVQTQYGLRDAVDVSVVVLTGPLAGQEYLGESFMAGKLCDQLRGLVGQMVLGRITLDPTARAGAMGPMVLADAGEEAANLARQWMDGHPGRIGFLRTEGARIAEARTAERAQQQQQGPGGPAGYGYPPGYGQGQQLQFQPAGGGFPAPPAPVSPPQF